MCSCGTKLLKYILLSFNIIFAISGLGILLAGAIILSDLYEFDHFVEAKLYAPPAVLIATGIIIFLIAILGCFGIIKESPALLFAYANLLAVVFIVELAVGIATGVFKSDLEKTVRNSLQTTIKRSNEEDMRAWNEIQRKLTCCGIDYPSDWSTMSATKSLPPSCCHSQYIDEEVGHCTESLPLGRDKYYQVGCQEKLKEHIEQNATVLIIVGIGVAFIQILGIILSCYLATKLQDDLEM